MDADGAALNALASLLFAHEIAASQCDKLGDGGKAKPDQLRIYRNLRDQTEQEILALVRQTSIALSVATER